MVSGYGSESDLWLLAEGRSSTMITSRMVENSRRQKASSTHRSLHPCGKQSVSIFPSTRETNLNTTIDNKNKTILTVWQSTSLKTLVVQMMKMMEAMGKK